MATTPDLQEPQIAAARAAAWHQTGEALLTLEAARTWLNEYGMILFAPRGTSLGAPAPSLVEATLGTAKSAATAAETDVARTLTARLVGEGSALPLNLLGGPGDLPDFLVSAQAFPFIFTLRGDKGWKRPPEATGAITPLALRVYEILAEKGALPIAEILPEVGREVTESAVARALGELWQVLRVLPVLQQGEGDTKWELTTSRFLKAVKAGANAGQPTALSGLVSLYLSQALVATEEEIAAFLSPLTGRARVREVLHALTAGRQLAEGVINGKTVLYIPDALPDFAQFAPEPTEEGEGDAPTSEKAAEGEEQAPSGERIRRFAGDKARPEDRNLRGKPVRREGAGDRSRDRAPRPASGGFDRAPRQDRGSAPGGGERRSFGSREGGASRPPSRFGAKRPSEGRSEFSRPWDEERASRPPRSTGDRPFSDRPKRAPRAEGEGAPERPFRSRDEGRPPRSFESRGDRPFGRSRDGGSEGDRPQRPFRPRPEGGSDRPQRPFRPRPEGAGDRPQRPFRERPAGDGDRPQRPFRERPTGDRPFRPRPDDDRPFRPRPEGDRPFRERPAGDRPFRSRPAGDGDRPQRPFRERPAGDRPFRERSSEDRPPRGDRPQGRPAGDRPFRPREGGAGGFGNDRRPAGRAPGRPAGRFGGGTDRPSRPRRDEGGAPRGGDGERSRPAFGSRFGGGAGRPPRGDRPQGRTGDRPAGRGGFRPAGGPSGDRPTGGAARPPRRPRPEDEA